MSFAGRYSVLLLLLLPLFGVAIFPDFDRVFLEEDHDVKSWNEKGWILKERVTPYEKIRLTFAIKQNNMAELEEIFWSVSDPKSKNYGQYMDTESVQKLVRPSEESIHVVKTWLSEIYLGDSGSCYATQNSDFIVCETTSARAEVLLLGAMFYRFEHPKSSRSIIRSSTHYSVPKHVAKHLDFVGGLLRFPALNYAIQPPGEDAVLDNVDIHVGVYPSVLRTRYNVSDTVGKHPNNSQAVAQFLEQYYSSQDLTEFFAIFGRGFTHLADVSKVVGPDTGRSGIEASLDVQYIMSLGANITTWFWSTDGRHETQEPFLEWIVAVGNTSNVPFVFSVSYGDNEDSLSTDYMNRINVEFMKAGVRGITILFASGDNGAGCKKKKFRPNFPCSSPYVTAVGGTAFNNPFGIGGEYGYEISGGGFSNVFQQPQYQNAAVNNFLKNSKKLPNTTFFNQSGRGYPDISAVCNHFWIVNNYIPVPGVMGTSASTPTVAGIVSLINDVRLQNNKPPMGFLNPFLYSNANSLYDPTTGYNEGCGEPDRGFYAMKGWDPVTGCGTPNYPALVEAALKIGEVYTTE